MWSQMLLRHLSLVSPPPSQLLLGGPERQEQDRNRVCLSALQSWGSGFKTLPVSPFSSSKEQGLNKMHWRHRAECVRLPEESPISAGRMLLWPLSSLEFIQNSIIGSGQQLRDHVVPFPFSRQESWGPEGREDGEECGRVQASNSHDP